MGVDFLEEASERIPEQELKNLLVSYLEGRVKIYPPKKNTEMKECSFCHKKVPVYMSQRKKLQNHFFCDYKCYIEFVKNEQRRDYSCCEDCAHFKNKEKTEMNGSVRKLKEGFCLSKKNKMDRQKTVYAYQRACKKCFLERGGKNANAEG